MDVSPLPHIIDASQPRRAHLVGVAGNGMRSLADVLLDWGWSISGSDLNVASPHISHQPGKPVNSATPPCRPAQAPADRGIRLFAGHAADNLPPDAEVVIFSDAVSADNPERRRAAELGIPTLSYFEMLGRIGVGRHTVAVAGTHGKSTTAAMTAHLLIQAGRDPTVVFGATPLGATSGGRAGSDTTMVVEACEYRANFLHLHSKQAAILGVEPDHFDCYDSLDQLENAFRTFAESIPGDGLLIARHDCESTCRVTAGLTCRVESFGLSVNADWSAHLRNENLQSATLPQFEIYHFGRKLCDVQLPTPGEHNVLNALAAAALAYENGVLPDQISAGLARFPGLHRRLELLGTWRDATLVDDYAHHPTEVTAALAAVRLMFPLARVWCVFQPHQACRTARLLDELAASLHNADKVMVADIFRAREGDPQPGEVTAADLARRTAELGVDVLPGHSDKEITETLETQLAPGDVLVTLGAGDVRKLLPTRPA
jgi:UDP-N-acetylmuramate--alanine ligase